MDKKRILLVDDEKDLVETIVFQLQSNGYEVIVAFDGIQGMQLAQQEKPDLIILDVMMPGMSGFKICDNLKMSSRTLTIPIIFLTAKDTAEDEKKGYEVGAVYYIKKPYEPDVLLEAIKKALELNKEFFENAKKRQKGILPKSNGCPDGKENKI